MKPRLKFVGYTHRICPTTYQSVKFSIYSDGIKRWLIGGGYRRGHCIGYEPSFLENGTKMSF